MTNSYKVDYFKKAHQALLSTGYENYARQLIPNGKNINAEYTVKNPTRTDGKAGSFKINIKTGVWADFATNDSGSDLISLTAYIKGVKPLEAACLIAGVPVPKKKPRGDVKASRTASQTVAKIIPLPNSSPANNNAEAPPQVVPEMTASSLTWRDKKHFQDSKLTFYTYFDKNNSPTGCVVRADFFNDLKKEFRQYSYDTGKKAWISSWHAPKPLFNLPEIVERKDAKVLVTEGEKTALAAKILFPEYIVTTSSGGANGANATDWTVLANRNVIIAPDNDDAGKGYLNQVIAILKKVGVDSIYVLNPQKLGAFLIENGLPQPRKDIPKGYDLADAVADGWDASLIESHRTSPEFEEFLEAVNINAIKESSGVINQAEYTGSDWEHIEVGGRNYVLSESKNWLLFEVLEKDEETGEKVKKYKPLSSYIMPTHRVINTQGHEGLFISLKNKNGTIIDSFLQKECLIDERETAKTLTRIGVEIQCLNSTWYNALMHYLYRFSPENFARGVDVVGWQGQGLANEVYLLPFVDNLRNVYTTPEHNGDEYILQSGTHRPLRSKGTLCEWKDTVGRVSRGNNLFVFCVTASLAAPCLKLFNQEGFCLHIKGSSSSGKSTALYVAGSVWGTGKPASFRTTDNAAESSCKSANDGLILLDEIAEITAESMSNLAYMLGNGNSKARATRDGTAKEITKFSVLAISSGECGLQAKLSEKNKEVTAGQSVRFIELEANQEKGLKTFDILHDEFNDGSEQANYLKEMSLKHCGVVIDKFLELITKEQESFLLTAKTLKQEFVKKTLTGGEDAQVRRVAESLSTCYAAGITASEAGIIPFSATEISEAYKVIFANWLATRGGKSSHELNTIKTKMRQLITEYSSSRFLENGRDDNRTLQILAGYKTEDEFWVDTRYFKKWILEGKRGFEKLLADDKYIIKDNDNIHYAKKCGAYNRRFYVIPISILEEETSLGEE